MGAVALPKSRQLPDLHSNCRREAVADILVETGGGGLEGLRTRISPELNFTGNCRAGAIRPDRSRGKREHELRRIVLSDRDESPTITDTETVN